MFYDKITSYFVGFWNRALNFKNLCFFEKFIFLILCFLEVLYKLAFLVIIFFKKKTRKANFNFKVVSVGNLSVGGTGKSVFVQFLVNHLNNLNSAIVLRGYQSQCSKTSKSFLVSDGKNIFCDHSFCGDEAFMMAESLGVFVVVGKKRFKSCQILNDIVPKIDFAVFDDSYQNFSVKKDFEILLLDARRPLENGHCLPAGRLREKDYSRTDTIILTHADLVNESFLKFIKDNILHDFDSRKIFCGKHKIQGLFLSNSKLVNTAEIKIKKFLVFAGIGSFDSFLKSLETLNINICDTIQYKDHFDYKKNDIDFIFDKIKKKNLDGAVTTQKDWVKLKKFLHNNNNKMLEKIYVLKIGFEFLTKEEERFFFNNIFWEKLS
ncbi:tetraacyldisaccharide 4'-kinase [Candidatus Dependentiae bacterium]